LNGAAASPASRLRNAAHPYMRERAGESVTRRKYCCMRLATECLRPVGHWREDARNWRLRHIGRRRAEETKPDRYTPQRPGVNERLKRPAFVLAAWAMSLNVPTVRRMCASRKTARVLRRPYRLTGSADIPSPLSQRQLVTPRAVARIDWASLSLWN